MRKLKFRVYDTIRKMFVTEHRTDNRLISISIDGTINYEYGTWNSDHLVIQQYTGINDKNGKEIYEGDIVSNRYIPEGFTVERVNFFDEEYGFISGFKLGGSPGKDDFRLFNNEDPALNEKVVGNIFEGIHANENRDR